MDQIQKRLQYVIEHIEEHLTEERQGVLDNATLAAIAGYSEFHFLRLFHHALHLTPADYIRKRRITEIVKRICSQDRPISDIAFEYGFNSKENFTRAFKKEHHILPTEYRCTNCSLRLYEPFDFSPKMISPTVSIQYMQPFRLTVYAYGSAFPPHCWNQYNSMGCSRVLSGGSVAEDYGAMLYDAEINGLRYYIGIRTELAAGNTQNTECLEIGGGWYAVFDTPPATQHDFVSTIRSTWDWIENEWLPSSGYRRAGGYELESYVESGRTFTERIYIPISADKGGI
ncbi:MAG: AraC family transcriptional regulator [Clostridia bacterium]|nr:AraC family transcriptional regulator [Clostridia bacterium]